MMRLVLEQGSQDDISAVALQVANALPTEEAFERLSAILKKTPITSLVRFALDIQSPACHTFDVDMAEDMSSGYSSFFLSF